MFTFKTEKSTGRYASFYPDIHNIKIKGVVVGSIGDVRPYKVRLMIFKDDINEDGNPNCEWKWITLKKESNSVNEAKEWLKTVYRVLIERYKIYLPKN